jgi:hypothetical protein
MDCSDARRWLDFARPGVAELDGPELEALESHLASCGECRGRQRSARRLDEQFGGLMMAVPIPADASNRLLAKLAAARRIWWRNRLLACTAAGLAILLGAVASYHYFGRATLDPFGLAQNAYEQAGQWRGGDEARSVADRWLKNIDDRLLAPAEWNYGTLAFLTRSDFEGVSSVPTMVFVRGDATARVYVVRTAAFKNLAAFDQPVEEGGCTVAVRRYAEIPGWAFIVVTTGASVERFLHQAIPQQSA